MDKPQDLKPKLAVTSPAPSRFVPLTAWKGQPIHIDPAAVQGVLQHAESEDACYVYLSNGQSPQLAMSAAAVLKALEGKAGA